MLTCPSAAFYETWQLFLAVLTGLWLWVLNFWLRELYSWWWQYEAPAFTERLETAAIFAAQFLVAEISRDLVGPRTVFICWNLGKLMYRLEELRPTHILYAELVAACWFMLMVCGLYLGAGLTTWGSPMLAAKSSFESMVQKAWRGAVCPRYVPRYMLVTVSVR